MIKETSSKEDEGRTMISGVHTQEENLEYKQKAKEVDDSSRAALQSSTQEKNMSERSRLQWR